MANGIAHGAAGIQTAAEAVARARLFTPSRMRSRPIADLVVGDDRAAAAAARHCRRPAPPAASASRSAALTSVLGTLHLRPSIRPLPRMSSMTSGNSSAIAARPCFSSSALRRDLVEEAVCEDDVEHGVADRHGQRIAAEGGAVHAGGHADRRRIGRQAGAHREAAADALGDRHDVGLDARPFIGEQLAGAADAALHLVEDQQQAVLVAELAQALQRLRRERADAALALHRLDQDRRRLRRDRLGGAHRCRRTAPGRSRRPSGRSLRDISAGRRRRSSPACGRGRRPRR